MAQRADRDLGAGGIDRHAAAVAVLQAHHTVHMRVARQQFAADALERDVEHAGHALHRGADGEQVTGADRAVGVAVAHEGARAQCGIVC